MTKNYYWDLAKTREQIVSEMRSNRIIAGSSDTVPGFLAPLTHEAFEQLNAVKGRTNKPYLIVINDKEKSFVFSNDGAKPEIARLMKACWPGPLTLILKAKPGIPAFLTSGSGTVALRVPHHEGMLEILKNFEGLFSTSANFSGKPTPRNVADIDPRIVDQVAFIVRDRHEHEDHKPSTIIDCTGSRITIVREGAYTREMLEKLGVKV